MENSYGSSTILGFFDSTYKYLQTISTLQALTGLIQPESISTYTLLAKPSYAFKPKFEPGKVNQIEQYMRCITTWNSDKQGDDEKVEKGFDILEPFINKESNIVVRKLFTEEDSVERVWHYSKWHPQPVRTRDAVNNKYMKVR